MTREEDGDYERSRLQAGGGTPEDVSGTVGFG